MVRWTIDKRFYSEEEAEGLLGEYLDIILYIESNVHNITTYEEIIEIVEMEIRTIK